MKITKRQLRRIIREEYSRLKRSGMIMENLEEFTPEEQVMVDKEITEFQAAKNRLDKGTGMGNEREYLQNMYYILESLAKGETEPSDWRRLYDRYDNFRIEMYQAILDSGVLDR